MLTTLMFSNAMALTCDIGDVPCNTANALRDLVNQQRPNSISDTLSGKRNTQFILDRLNELFNAGPIQCEPLGISAVEVTSGAFTGEWIDIDFNTLTPLDNGSYAGNFTGNNEFAGAWDFGGVGNWGRYHFPSGKMGALRDGVPGEGVVVGGIARINGTRSVAWGVHASCPPGTDVAATFSTYMPQLERYAGAPSAPNPFPECLPFDVTTTNPAATGLECECTAAVCAADPFCCENSWDGICVNEVADYCVAGGPQ